MINKIKYLQYNILSLINVFLGFLFILYLGRKFGAGKETDIYFLSIVIINYLGYFVQSVWEAMGPYYVELRIKDKNKVSELFSILLNDVVLVALIIIFLYFIINSYFLSNERKAFLDIFIFYLIFQNILFLNKTVLNLEHYYASFYLVDIFVYLSLFVVVIFTNNIFYLAYAIIIATLLANIYQFFLIFFKVGLKYKLKFFDKNFVEIYKNSFKLKLGSIFYGSKDILIASVFTNAGEGIYSLFSYASKFASVILQIVNAPIVNIFATKANYLVANKEYKKLKEMIKKVLSQTVTLYIISTIIVYFILPYLLNILFGNKFNNNDFLIIQKLFLLMSIFYLILAFQSPFGRLIIILKCFNASVLFNIIFMFLVIIVYYIFNKHYINFLFGLIFAQIIQSFFIYNNLKGKLL